MRNIALIFWCLAGQALSAPQAKAVDSARNGARAIIVSIRTGATVASHESRIQLYGAPPESSLSCALDFSSSDGEHGFEVVKAAWTPDGEYFVFSLTASGGHQPWHSPTYFYSQRSHLIFKVDPFAGGVGVSNPNFTLTAPDVLKIETLMPDGKRVAVHEMLSNRHGHTSSQFECTEGRTIKVSEK